MRVAVLGLGRIGRLHARILAEIPAVDEVVLSDVDASAVHAIATQIGGSAAATPEEALGRADAVVIATPPESHAPLAHAALDAGLAVFCEKPLAADLEGSLALTERVEASGSAFQVGFQRRFDPGYAEARRRVETGELGELRLLRLTARDPFVEGPVSPGVSILRDSSVHDFDLARWLTRREVVEVTAIGSRPGVVDLPSPEDARTLAVAMRLEDGIVAILDATWLHPFGYDIRTELVGSRDAVSVGLDARTPQHPVEPELRAATDGNAEQPMWQGYLERFADAYRLELEAFVEVARGKRPSPCTARDGLEAMRVAVAAARSLAEGRSVGVSSVGS